MGEVSDSSMRPGATRASTTFFRRDPPRKFAGCWCTAFFVSTIASAPDGHFLHIHVGNVRHGCALKVYTHPCKTPRKRQRVASARVAALYSRRFCGRVRSGLACVSGSFTPHRGLHLKLALSYSSGVSSELLL